MRVLDRSVPLLLISLLVAAMLFSVAFVCSAPAVAEDGWTAKAQAEKPEIQQVSYTVGETPRKLKWLPYRPTVPGDGKAVAAKHYTAARPASVRRSAQRGAGDPFADPFGDRGQLPDAPARQGTLGDDVLQRPVPVPVGQPQGDFLGRDPLGGPSKALDEAEKEIRASEDALAESFIEGQVDLVDKCPSPDELKPIAEVTTDIKAQDGDFPPECTLGEKTFEPRAWAPNCFTWKASGLCHKPLYFEDVQLERYGHSWGPFLQPVISSGHFFLTVPILPYKMGLNPPCECLYTLGYYRPGSCAPYMLDPLPLSIRATLWEAGAWVGGVAAIP